MLIDRWHDHARIGNLSGKASVSANDAPDLRPYALGIFQRLHQIDAHVHLPMTAPNGKDEYEILRLQATSL